MTLQSLNLIFIQEFGFWLCGGPCGRNDFIFIGIHPINTLNLAKSVIMNINPLSIIAGKWKGRHYLTFSRGKGIHLINTLNFAKSFIMPIPCLLKQ